jgi:hypothetical protein
VPALAGAPPREGRAPDPLWRECLCTGCPCADLAALNRPAALGCDPVANARVQATSVVVPRRVSWEDRVASEGHHDSVPSP